MTRRGSIDSLADLRARLSELEAERILARLDRHSLAGAPALYELVRPGVSDESADFLGCC